MRLLYLMIKISCKMKLPCKLVCMDERSCKLHVYVIAISIWCHILSFVTIILCDLSKATRPCSKSHVIITTKN